MLRVISNSNEIGRMMVAVPRVLLSVAPPATLDLNEGPFVYKAHIYENLQPGEGHL